MAIRIQQSAVHVLDKLGYDLLFGNVGNRSKPPFLWKPCNPLRH